jgi:hypothetical protein
MLTIEEASAEIVVQSNDARPSLNFWTGWLPGMTGPPANTAVWHLTKGYSNPLVAPRPAFTFTGRIRVAGPASELAVWRFGFIQFCRVISLEAVYGDVAFLRPQSEGITVNWSQPPAMPQKLSLDSLPGCAPFTNNLPTSFAGGVATHVTGDHPAGRVGQSLTFIGTDRSSPLTSVTDSREFWSVFAGREPAGRLHYFAHVHWKLHWHYVFDPSPAMPMLPLSASSATFDQKATLGAPTDPQLAPLLAAPAAPFNNHLLQWAQTTAFRGGAPNRIETTVTNQLAIYNRAT